MSGWCCSARASATIVPQEWPTTTGRSTPSWRRALWSSSACWAAVHRLPARALAVAEAGTIENDDPMALRQELSHPAGVPVVPAHRVAVDQHDGAALAPVGVVQPHAVHLQEGASGRVPALRPAGHEVVPECERGQGSSPCKGGFLPAERALDVVKRGMVVLCCAQQISGHRLMGWG